MYNFIMIILGVVWVMLSFVLYYTIGRALGGLRHGRLLTAVVITAVWVLNSIGNAGGIDHLMWLIQNIDGFVVGMILVLIPMQLVAFRGTQNYIILTKEKWLM